VKDEDIDVEELGFEPAVPASATERAPRSPRARSRRSGLRRKLTSAAVLFGALGATAGAYAVFATSSGAADASSTSVERGKQLYEVSCITCHGANLQGVKGRGVSLTGVGGAAVYFQVSTGRMPATGQGAYEPRKEAKFDDADTRALAAYVQSVGGGTEIPTGELRGDSASIAEGGVLFRLNCASCHGTTFKGAPLSAGKQAPSLNDSTDLQIQTAMLTGPENMPVFSNNQLTPDQKRAIVAYVQTLKASKDPGGNGIDRIGPVSEAIVLWVGGVGALMIVILWIGAKTE
jgi:ubiquinol-cytochrome c reductase cytochrome c subunit